MVISGVPISLIFTCILHEFRVHLTELPNKALEALNNYFRLQITNESEDELKNAIEIVEKLSEENKTKVVRICSPDNDSILCHLMKSKFPRQKKLQLCNDLIETEFPLQKDCFQPLTEILDEYSDLEHIRDNLLYVNGTVPFESSSNGP